MTTTDGDTWVREFAAALYEILDQDAWGEIEPEVFANVGAGLTGGEADFEDKALFDKLTVDEARDACAGMRGALKLAWKKSRPSV